MVCWIRVSHLAAFSCLYVGCAARMSNDTCLFCVHLKLIWHLKIIIKFVIIIIDFWFINYFKSQINFKWIHGWYVSLFSEDGCLMCLFSLFPKLLCFHFKPFPKAHTELSCRSMSRRSFAAICSLLLLSDFSIVSSQWVLTSLCHYSMNTICLFTNF